VSVGVVTDSSCDLPQPLADELGIRIVPLTIRFGREEFLDRRDLTPSEFWARWHDAAAAPETAAPAPGLFEAMYRGLAERGIDGIVVVTMSSALSGTMQSAELAARSVRDLVPVEVIDSRTATAGLGMIAAAAARRARSGAALDEVAAQSRELADRTQVWAMLDSLEGLRQSGRVGAAKAAVAEAFAVKPIVELRDGHIDRHGRPRTRRRALEVLVAKVRAARPLTSLGVLHADAGDLDAFVEALAPLSPGPMMVTDVGPVIGSHCGRRAVGVAFQTADSIGRVCREVGQVLN
jgi:DegV family protein with EDD domain